MTPADERADRNGSVRAAARAWKNAGVLDDAAVAAVDAACPDDRQGVGPVFRVLLFLFTLISVNGAFGFVWALTGSNTTAAAALPVLLLVFGIALLAATEFQITQLRRTRGGVEAATSLAGISSLIGFAFWLFDKAGLKEDHAFAATLVVAAVLLAGAAWRWGYPLYAGAAVAAFLGSFPFFPGARLVWIVLPLIAAPALTRLSESARLPPSQRASCAAALGVALAALYVAVHLGSLDAQVLELERADRLPASDVLRRLSIAATALVPIVYLILGLRSRRYVFLLLGAGTAVASLITLRWYVHLAPLWVVLTLSGAALVGTVLALRRYLDSGADRERHGYTAEPLFEEMGKRRMLEAGAAVLSLSPEARPVHEEPKFAGGGGEFGGGGASSGF